MEWEVLKKEIYYWDGAWLDLYVLNATQEDWKKWVNYVNSKFELSFYNGQTDSKESNIYFPAISDYWAGKTDLMSDAIVKLGSTNIKCHFFVDTKIENDFDPGEVESIEDHNKLIDYMIDISKLIGKPVIMTPENTPDFFHISVTQGEVKINLR